MTGLRSFGWLTLWGGRQGARCFLHSGSRPAASFRPFIPTMQILKVTVQEGGSPADRFFVYDHPHGLPRIGDQIQLAPAVGQQPEIKIAVDNIIWGADNNVRIICDPYWQGLGQNDTPLAELLPLGSLESQSLLLNKATPATALTGGEETAQPNTEETENGKSTEATGEKPAGGKSAEEKPAEEKSAEEKPAEILTPAQWILKDRYWLEHEPKRAGWFS